MPAACCNCFVLRLHVLTVSGTCSWDARTSLQGIFSARPDLWRITPSVNITHLWKFTCTWSNKFIIFRIHLFSKHIYSLCVLATYVIKNHKSNNFCCHLVISLPNFLVQILFLMMSQYYEQNCRKKNCFYSLKVVFLTFIFNKAVLLGIIKQALIGFSTGSFRRFDQYSFCNAPWMN